VILRAIYQSPALRAAVVFGLGGVAFTVGNLILARVLAPREYGLLSLVIGVVTVAGLCAPMGLDFAVARRGLTLGPQLRRTALASSAIVGLATVVISAALYHLPVDLLLAIFVATVGMGTLQAVAAHFQGQRQFGLAMPFAQVSSWALLLVGIVAWVLRETTATGPSALVAISMTATAAVGWFMLAQRTRRHDRSPLPAGLWGEALSLVTINLAGALLLQLERLIIPMTIGIKELALFGVATALVGWPFRMMQSAVNFTVVPRLRDAGSVAARRHLLWRELLIFSVVVVPVTLLIWLLAPPITRWFLGDRYDLSTSIVLAMIISGLLKVLSAFGTSVVSALAPDRGLWLLSTFSWLCIVVSIGLAFAFRPYGLCGAVYAVSVGWFLRTCIALSISAPHLRLDVR
jgi:PST family polysaccharide transporter